MPPTPPGPACRTGPRALLCVTLAAALAGCGGIAPPIRPVTAQPVQPQPGQLLPGQRQAFFAAWPDSLLSAATAACAGPGQRPAEELPGTVRCETLPTPDIAAALILTYGGTVESVPLYIVSFTTTPGDGGYLVTADSYILVPQTDGTRREVRLADRRVEDGMTELMVAAGGQPV